MRKCFRFVISTVFCLSLALSLCPAYALAADGDDQLRSGDEQTQAADSSVSDQDSAGSEAADDSESDSELEPAPDPDPTTNPTRKYTMNAKGKKGSWTYKTKRVDGKKVKVKVSYRFKDGTYPARITKIGSSTYYFKNSKGVLGTSSSSLRVVKVGKKHYCPSSSGKLVSGWRVVHKKLYYFGGSYKCAYANRSKSGIKFGSSGKAKKTLESKLKVQCITILSKITKRSASKSTKLRAAWRYMVSRSRWTYTIYDFSLLKKDWAKRYAYTMFCRKHGDCYGFAAGFAALAAEIGYKPYVIACRVPGSRDHAADGYTRHGLVTINGRFYDPEAQFAGWGLGIYNSSQPYGMKSVKKKKYTSFDGSGSLYYIYQKAPAKTKYLVFKKNGHYYGRKDIASGPKITGLWCIKSKLYLFNDAGKMSENKFKKLKKLSKRESEWKSLKAMIGKPKSIKTSSSCYGDGVDVTYTYKRVMVTTFRPSEGTPEIVLSFSAL